MEVNLNILIIVGVCAVILIAFTVWRNLKDKKDLTDMMNEEDKIKDEPDLKNDE